MPADPHPANPTRPSMHTQPHPRHRGSTLLGFAAGLLVGLALALALALYVTRSATPLEDRNAQRPVTTDAQEAEQNRNWNPNAGLSTRPISPAALPAAAPATTPADAATGATTPTPAPSPADPLAQLIEQRTAAAAAPAAPTAAAASSSYFVQAGAFGSAEEAQAQRARLAMLGFDARVSERAQDGRSIFRVRLGPFASQAEAEAVGQRLQAQNVEIALVRVMR